MYSYELCFKFKITPNKTVTSYVRKETTVLGELTIIYWGVIVKKIQENIRTERHSRINGE